MLTEEQEPQIIGAARQTCMTSGPWNTEPEAMRDLDSRLNRCGLFTPFAEVRGWLQQPRVGAEEKNMRIDRVLVPNTRLRDAGWAYGCIGIEGKQPDTKIGPVVSQCMDYGRTVWDLKDLGGLHVMTPWIFIWHLQEFCGDIESVMAQQRIGGAWGSRGTLLALKSSGGTLLRVDENGEFKITSVRCGLKAGSR